MLHPLIQVDAFADRPLDGNPCAVVLDADDLDAATMQRVAQEMNLSETVFVLEPGPDADLRARYFTPGSEIPFAGHPTISTLVALAAAGRIEVPDGTRTLRLELPAGVIEVDVVGRDGRVVEVILQTLEPRFLQRLDAADVLPAFGLAADDALPGAPIQVVSTGTPQLFVPLRDLATLRRMRVDREAANALCEREKFFGPHLFCLEGATRDGDTFARHPFPPDWREDPFTGSATASLGAWLWHHGLIPEPRFVAEQGHDLGRPGRARVEVLGTREAPRAVRVAGAGVVVLRGELELSGS